jgi:flagellar biosynthesis GTPase FlhF
MTRSGLLRSVLIACAACGLLLATAGSVQAQQYDPQNDQAYDTAQSAYPATTQGPGRVARLAYLAGQVQFAPAGEDAWGSADINRPMVLGDRLLTGDNGLAAVELGDASVRVDNDSAFDFLNLSEENIQIELSQGTLNLAVRQMDQGENFEVDTPTIAFVASTPGVFRVDNNPDGTGSMVTVFQGSGTVYGANGASRQVEAGQSYRFNDSSLSSVAVDGLPRPDDFDRFCESRDANYARYAEQQQQYVPPDMIGGDQLSQYGQWDDEPQYGNVWYPTSVSSSWAPYRDGHWAWIDPWGWTWVDNQPWGFAPFHYGRWVYIRNRWGWMPGPRDMRPVYAPALVAFIGGSGVSISLRIGGGNGPVGWFPLGPRDVYVPWFHASRRYFDRVNVTNIRNVYVNQTIINNVYNDYSHNRYDNLHRYNRYAYRNQAYAVTAVPRNVFAGARPVRPAVLRLDRKQLGQLQAIARPGVIPDKASLGLRQPQRRIIDIRNNRPFVKPVVARHAPAPRPVSFNEREKVIANQHGQPLTRVQMQDLRKQRPATRTQPERVRLVPALAGATQRTTPSQRPGNAARPATPPGPYSTQPFKNTVHPIPARVQPLQPAHRPGALPSAGFAHPGEPRNPLRPSRAQPAGTAQPERLPIVRPVERAPLNVENNAAQQQRRLQQQTQQRAREQQMQQQREAQMQAQQRAREQQAQQQREVQMQAQQRVREQQVQQQQREVQMQTQQRTREQQMQQQQGEVQMQAQQRVREQQVQQQQREVQMQTQQRVREQQRREPPPKKHPRDSSDGGRQQR